MVVLMVDGGTMVDGGADGSSDGEWVVLMVAMVVMVVVMVMIGNVFIENSLHLALSLD